MTKMQAIFKKGLFLLIIVIGVLFLVDVAWRRSDQQSILGPQNIIPDSAVSSDGVRIAYREKGTGLPTLVFVHGWSGNRTFWDKQVDYFSKTHSVVTIDLGGHGESGLNRTDWTIEAFGKDVLTVTDKLNLSQFILIGHSMGGPVILEAARQIPDKNKVVGLIGVDTFQNTEVTYSQEQIDQFLLPFRSNFVEHTADSIRGWFIADSDPALIEDVIKSMTNISSDVAISALENLLKYDERLALETIQVPITAINSSQSTNTPFSVKLKIMQNVGHFLMMEAPEQFNQILSEAIVEFEHRSPTAEIQPAPSVTAPDPLLRAPEIVTLESKIADCQGGPLEDLYAEGSKILGGMLLTPDDLQSGITHTSDGSAISSRNLVISFKEGTAEQKKYCIIAALNSRISGWIPETQFYEIQLMEEKTGMEIEKIIAELLKVPAIATAEPNYASTLELDE